MRDDFSVEHIVDIVLKAGKIARDHFINHDYQTLNKSAGQGPVTAADVEVEYILRHELLKLIPTSYFLGEETGEDRCEDLSAQCPSYRWIVDPIDGTNNYINDVPYFAVSVALEHIDENGERETVAAVTYSPVRGILHWASKGHGTYVAHVNSSEEIGAKAIMEQGKRLNFSHDSSQRNVTVGGRDNTGPIKELGYQPLHVGSCVEAMLAVCGNEAAACHQHGVHTHDITGPELIITEAGGTFIKQPIVKYNGKPAFQVVAACSLDVAEKIWEHRGTIYQNEKTENTPVRVVQWYNLDTPTLSDAARYLYTQEIVTSPSVSG